MHTSHTEPLTVGKYLLSPLARLCENGYFNALLSVRSGRGQGTHDRIYTFIPEFATRESALRYAAAQAQDWIHPTPAMA